MIILTATLIAFVLAAAVAQGAFQYVAPALSDRTIGNTDASTYFLIFAVGILYFAAASTVPRWLRTTAPVVWLLLPIAVVYLIAIFGQPGAYRCNPAYVAGCGVIRAPFVVGAIGAVIGYAAFGRRARSSRGAAV